MHGNQRGCLAIRLTGRFCASTAQMRTGQERAGLPLQSLLQKLKRLTAFGELGPGSSNVLLGRRALG